MKTTNASPCIDRRDFIGLAAGASALATLGSGATLFGASATTPAGRSAQGDSLYWAWWGWEPMAHYRRTGRTVGGVDTRSPTLEQWFDRLHSEPLARQMAGLGINLAVTHFFKGFGLVAERAEQQRTATLVKHAHVHGIKVVGYCQSGSLYHEQFLAEQPHAADWIKRDEKGELRTWGGAKFRWSPCILSTEFRDYMKQAIRVGLQDIGLDGLHFDNDYSVPCYCPRCVAGFRGWMARRFPSPQKRFGRASFADLPLPATETVPGRIEDPVAQEWVRFRCESLAEYHADLCGYARQLRPGVILIGNPAYPRGPNSPYRRSVWPAQVGRHLTFMFAENGNFSGVDDGVMVSQIRAYKQAAAVGYRVISTVWRRTKTVSMGLPESANEIALQIAEAAANGGVPGTNWALRPQGKGDGLRIDRADLSAALANSLRFARAQEKLLAGGRPVRDVAVLRTLASLSFNAPEADPLVEAAEEAVIRRGFAWETVFGDDLTRLDGFAALVVAGQSHLSDAEVDKIRDFVARGGALVLVGENGTRDENGHPRSRPAFDGLDSRRIARVDPGAMGHGAAASTAATPGESDRSSVPLPAWADQLAAAIERSAGGRISVQLKGSSTVSVSAAEFPGNRHAVHLVNYASDPTPSGLTLELGVNGSPAPRSARLLVPDGPEQTLAIQAGTRPSLILPPFTVYGLLVLS